MWYGVSAGSGRLAVDPRSGTPGGRIGRGERIGLDASGDEYGRENNGTAVDDDEGSLGDCARGCCTAREEWKRTLVLGADGSVKSMKSGIEPRAAFESAAMDVDGDEDVNGLLSEDELAALSSKTDMDVSGRDSAEVTQESRGGCSESCTTAAP